MKRNRRSKPESWLRIARERIDILFREAEREASKKPKRADRYVFLARKLAMKYNIKLKSEFKKKFCHKCYSYFAASNVSVRTNSKTKAVEYKCKKCGGVTRFGYSKEQRAKN